jgi:hypothetical protein
VWAERRIIVCLTGNKYSTVGHKVLILIYKNMPFIVLKENNRFLSSNAHKTNKYVAWQSEELLNFNLLVHIVTSGINKSQLILFSVIFLLCYQIHT